MTTPPPPPMPQAGSSVPSSDNKTMALICHFGMVIFGWIPALIIYFVKGDSPFVKREAAKAFNFAIIPSAVSMLISLLYTAGVFETTTTNNAYGYRYSVSSNGGLACLFILLSSALWLVTAIFAVINGIKVNDGKESKYPFGVPILK